MQTARKSPRTLSLWRAHGEEEAKNNDGKIEYLTAEDQVVRCLEVGGRLRSRCAGLLEIKFVGIYSYDETLQYGSLQVETKLPQSRFAPVESTVQYLH